LNLNNSNIKRQLHTIIQLFVIILIINSIVSKYNLILFIHFILILVNLKTNFKRKTEKQILFKNYISFVNIKGNFKYH